MTNTPSSFSSQMRSKLPEEILEHILSLALCSEPPSRSSYAHKASPLSVLLVCKTFDRIAKPFLYASIHVHTREQSNKLADVLDAQPALATYIRSIRVEGPSSSRALLVAAQHMANSQETKNRTLDLLDVRLVDERSSPSKDKSNPNQTKYDLEQLHSALCACPDTKRLVVRQNGYINLNTSASFIQALAKGILRWHSLECVDLWMSLSMLPPLPGQPHSDPLAEAFSKSPNLKVFRTRRPTLLNTFLLDIAGNPMLERIELLDGNNGTRERSSHAPRTYRPTNGTMASELQHQFKTYFAARGSQLEPLCRRSPGMPGLGAEIFCAATAELATQLEQEPQTLFASQIVSHPRLNALVHAGRLQVIMERLQMSRNGRNDVYSMVEKFNGSIGSIAVHPCICPGMGICSVQSSACAGCPALRAAF